MKDQVYSWRLDAELKNALEDAARSENVPISSLLETIVSDWLAQQRSRGEDEEIQHRLRVAALQCAGKLHGGDPSRAQQASKRIRDKLKRQRAG